MFFCDVNGDHRDLHVLAHSFPTRRSTGLSRLAPSPPRDMTVHALDDPSIEIDEADIAPGRDGYPMMCSACHGIRLSSPGAPGPDPRESPIALHMQSVRAVLKDGSLMSQGMPGFQAMSNKQVRQISASIRPGAREEIGSAKVRTPVTNEQHVCRLLLE